MSTRRVVVDDADSRIQYHGSGWFTAAGDDSLGTDGPTYMGSQHGIKGDGSLTFSFEGTSIELYGTNGQVPFSGAYDPKWGCNIDGNSVSSRSGSSEAQNNWPLCATDSLDPGMHQLVVSVTGVGDGTFWFDRLMYTPLGFPPSGSVTWVDATRDSAFQYDSNWHSANVMITTVPGASVSFNFEGSGLTWVGEIPGDSEISPTSLTYTIDGSNPVTVPMVGRSSKDAPPEENHIFFATPHITSGSHTIKVTYNGDSNTPLTVAYVYVQDQLQDTPPLTFGSGSSSPLTFGAGSLSGSSTFLTSSPSPSGSGSLSGSSSFSSSSPSFFSHSHSVSASSPSQSLDSLPLNSTSSTLPTTPSNLSSPLPPNSRVAVTHSSNPWIIVSAVFGGISALILLIWLFKYRQRRRQQPNMMPNTDVIPNPFTMISLLPPAYNESMVQVISKPSLATNTEVDQVTSPSGQRQRETILSLEVPPPSYTA